MSGLLQLLSSCFLFILFVSFVSSLSVNVSPAHLYFSGNPGREECKFVKVYSDSKDLLVETRWSESESRRIEDFIFSAEDMGLNLRMPDRFSTGSGEVKICLKKEDSFKYSGVLLFYPEDYGAGVGVWIDTEGKSLKNIKKPDKSESKITGGAIFNEDFSEIPVQKSGNNNYILITEFIFTLLLLGVLCYLVFFKQSHLLSKLLTNLVNNKVFIV